ADAWRLAGVRGEEPASVDRVAWDAGGGERAGPDAGVPARGGSAPLAIPLDQPDGRTEDEQLPRFRMETGDILAELDFPVAVSGLHLVDRCVCLRQRFALVQQLR